MLAEIPVCASVDPNHPDHLLGNNGGEGKGPLSDLSPRKCLGVAQLAQFPSRPMNAVMGPSDTLI